MSRMEGVSDDALRAAIVGSGVSEEDRKRTEASVAWALGRAEESRTRSEAFFEFVMTDEHTRRQVRAMPHQKVLLSFIAHHPHCVVRLPVGCAKTYTTAALVMWLLGQDATERGAIVSATQMQAAKPLGMVRDYIEQSWRLKLVFPQLRKSPRRGDSWAGASITVDRPPGIRDPSIVAVGLDGALAGARLGWLVVDDILTRENTYTPEQRQKVHEWFDSTALSRLDPSRSRCVVTNTAWSPDDLTFRLEKAGWPTISMDIEGGIWFENADAMWDSDELRPGMGRNLKSRLVAHDHPRYAIHAGSSQEEVDALLQRGASWFDTEERVPLWPERYDGSFIEKRRQEHLSHRFNQLFMSVCRDDATARCKTDWIEQGKEKGRGMTTVERYDGGNIVVTGVDLAVGKGRGSDFTALFTFEHQPDGHRLILDVEFGQWDAPTIVKKILDRSRRYGSIIRVENNAAQDYIIQFARALNVSVPIKAHATGRSKAHPEFGVEGLFVELQNGAWIIPCSRTGQCAPGVQRWIDECLEYEPGKHTGDVLMASWLAREQARQLGAKARMPGAGPVQSMSQVTGSLARRVMSR